MYRSDLCYQGHSRLETRKHRKQLKRCSSTNDEARVAIETTSAQHARCIIRSPFQSISSHTCPKLSSTHSHHQSPKNAERHFSTFHGRLGLHHHPVSYVSKSLFIAMALDASFGGVGAKLAYAADLRIHRFVLWRVGPRGQLGRWPRRCRIMHEGSPRGELCPDSWARPKVVVYSFLSARCAPLEITFSGV
jgi:hypothetical protein